MKTITREQYMENASELHHEYFLQFATKGLRDFVNRTYSVETIKEALKQDEHLNSNLLNIPGYKAKPTLGYNGSHWMSIFDEITRLYSRELSEVNFRINGVRSCSPSMGTCAIKAYMREKIK